jgi:hypothetical protein
MNSTQSSGFVETLERRRFAISVLDAETATAIIRVTGGNFLARSVTDPGGAHHED